MALRRGTFGESAYYCQVSERLGGLRCYAAKSILQDDCHENKVRDTTFYKSFSCPAPRMAPIERVG